jgi:hypothetical protein
LNFLQVAFCGLPRDKEFYKKVPLKWPISSGNGARFTLIKIWKLSAVHLIFQPKLEMSIAESVW